MVVRPLLQEREHFKFLTMYLPYEPRGACELLCAVGKERGMQKFRLPHHSGQGPLRSQLHVQCSCMHVREQLTEHVFWNRRNATCMGFEEFAENKVRNN
jgi:hypothetical protein